MVVAVQEGGLPLGQTGGVGQQLGDGDVVLAAADELGPVGADLVIDAQQAAVDQQHDGLGGGHDLGDGGQVEHGVDGHLTGVGGLDVGGVGVVGALGGVVVVSVAVGLVQDDLAVLDGQDDSAHALSTVGVLGTGLQLVVQVGPVGVGSSLDLGPGIHDGLLVVGAVQEGDDLGTGAVAHGVEGGGGSTGGDAVLQSPQSSVVVEGALSHVGEGVLGGVGGLALSAVQEADGLSTGAGLGSAEHILGGAVGDAVLQSPQDSVIVEVAFLHVHEGVDDGGSLGAALGAPQEGDDVCTVAQLVGTEGGLGHAVGDAILHGPQNGLIEECGLLHIGEAGLALLCHDGHGHQGADHAQDEDECQDSLAHKCFLLFYVGVADLCHRGFAITTMEISTAAAYCRCAYR